MEIIHPHSLLQLLFPSNCFSPYIRHFYSCIFPLVLKPSSYYIVYNRFVWNCRCNKEVINTSPSSCRSLNVFLKTGGKSDSCILLVCENTKWSYSLFYIFSSSSISWFSKQPIPAPWQNNTTVTDIAVHQINQWACKKSCQWRLNDIPIGAVFALTGLPG